MAKSKLTKAKEISYETKCKVLDRQGNRSITGVFLSPYNTEFHHVIPRSASGIGAEWNICAITSEEHRAFHDHQYILVNGRKRYTYLEFDILMKNHLKKMYLNMKIYLNQLKCMLLIDIWYYYALHGNFRRT